MEAKSGDGVESASALAARLDADIEAFMAGLVADRKEPQPREPFDYEVTPPNEEPTGWTGEGSGIGRPW